MTAPRRNRPTPADFATGLGTWAAYVAFRRSKRPARWVLKHVRRALFGWSDYLRYLREQSVVEGVFGGRKVWLVLGAGLWGTRALRRAVSRSERIVLNEVVQPGDRIVITQLPRKAPRKERKAARRAS